MTDNIISLPVQNINQAAWDKLQSKFKEHSDYHDGPFQSVLISYDPDGYFQLSCTEKVCATTLRNLLTEALWLVDVAEGKESPTGTEIPSISI